jgi:hypothetical protein
MKAHVALSHVLPLSHLLPYFPILMLSLLHLVIFRHPYFTHTKSYFRIFLVLWIQHFIFFTSTIQIFTWRKSCLQTLRNSYGVINLWRYPFVEIILYENQDGICFLWDLGLWILTIQPSHSYTLPYCRPTHPISIEFQNIDNYQGSPP